MQAAVLGVSVMAFMGWIRGLLLLLFTAAAARSDWKERKIRNQLNLYGVLAALLTGVLQWDAAQLADLLASSAAAFALGFVLWKLSVFRAGDAKLLWCVGTFCGLHMLPQTLAAIFLAAGVCALVLMLRHHVLFQRLKRVGQHLWIMAVQRKFVPYPILENDPCAFPFAVAVMAGVWFTVILTGIPAMR